MAWLRSLLRALGLAAADPHEPKDIDVDELEALLNDGKVLLLDVREPLEIKASGAVKGYRNIPLGSLHRRLAEIPPAIPKDKPIVTFCARGVRAATAGAILNTAGYQVIGCTGMHQWKAGNKPVVPG